MLTTADRARSTILVIAKAPRPGHSKTRLCPPRTADEAAQVAGAALADTLAVVGGVDVGRRVLVLDGDATGWRRPGFDLVTQRGAGLDERLAAAFDDVAGSGSTGPMLLVGMDTPQVTASLIDASLDLLCQPGHDAVLGLAADGGWWAIGLHAADPDVFVGVEMSTARTGRDQQDRLEARGLRVAALPVLRDVDHWSDATAVAAEAPDTRFAELVHALDRCR